MHVNAIAAHVNGCPSDCDANCVLRIRAKGPVEMVKVGDANKRFCTV